MVDVALVVGEEGPEIDDLDCKRDLTNAEQRVQQRSLLHVERIDDLQELQHDEGVGEKGVLGQVKVAACFVARTHQAAQRHTQERVLQLHVSTFLFEFS